MIGAIMTRGSFGSTLDYVLDPDGDNDKIVTILDCEGLTLDWDGPLYKEEEIGEGDIDPTEMAEGETTTEYNIDEAAEGDDALSDDANGLAESGPKEHTSSPPPIAPMVADFEKQASNNPKVEKPVRHFYLSYSPKDAPKLTNAVMAADARAYLKAMGFGNTQFIIVRHSEKNNPHVHIVANVVDNDFKKIPEKFSIKKNIEVCQRITIEKGYTWGDHKACSEVQEMHNPIDKVKADLSMKIVSAMEHCSCLNDLPKQLEKLGVGCTIKTDSNNKPVGISFSITGKDKNGKEREYKFAGSHVQKQFSVRNIAMTCELHKDMSRLVSCANKLDKHCITFGSEMSPMVRKYHERLRQVLSQEARERKRLEYKYKEVDKKGKVWVMLALLVGGPFLAVVPELYYSIKKTSLVNKHGLADRSIDATLEKLRTAQRVMRNMEERERAKKEAFLKYRQMENFKNSQSSPISETTPSVEKVQKPVQKQEQQETVQPRPYRMRR